MFERVLALAREGVELTPAALAEGLAESERRTVFELAFDDSAAAAGSLEEARSCLAALQRRRLEGELREVQLLIQKAEQAKDSAELKRLLGRKQELRQSLAEVH